MTDRLRQLLGFLESTPDDPFLLFAVAKEFEGMMERNRALEYYNKLVDEHPGYVGTYYHLGKLHERLGDLDAAVAAYEKGMQAAKNANDRHALGELQNAKLELEEG